MSILLSVFEGRIHLDCENRGNSARRQRRRTVAGFMGASKATPLEPLQQSCLGNKQTNKHTKKQKQNPTILHESGEPRRATPLCVQQIRVRCRRRPVARRFTGPAFTNTARTPQCKHCLGNNDPIPTWRVMCGLHIGTPRVERTSTL